ncbi:hypothetical protein Sjap_022919 [Stephania japonica]|uniref:Uncharacterized protein n=1 Tax=Stephania japonica TaxID=461633 RepID=A0AAP0HU21_9MAGN
MVSLLDATFTSFYGMGSKKEVKNSSISSMFLCFCCSDWNLCWLCLVTALWFRSVMVV